jgi:undecaprenyl-diphosphatase
MDTTTHAHRRRILPIGFAVAAVACVLSKYLVDTPLSSWLSTRNRIWTDAPSALGIRQLGKVWALVWLLFLWVTASGRTRPVTTALLALLFTMLFVLPLKEIVGRVRPMHYLALPIEAVADIPLTGHSFPSGDMATICAVTFSLVCVLSWRAWSVLLGLCLLVGWLRLVVLAHHLSDVWAGAAIGILCAYLALLVDHSGFFDSRRLDRHVHLVWMGVILWPVLWCLEGFVPPLSFGVTVAPVAVLVAVVSKWRRAAGDLERR